MLVFFDIGNCLYDPYRTFKRTIAALGHGAAADEMLAKIGTYPDQPGRHDPLLRALGMSAAEIDGYFHEFIHHPVFHAGSPEILDRLREMGVHVGVISDGDFDTQIQKLRAWGVADRFSPEMVFIGSSPENRGRAPGFYPKGVQLEGSKHEVATFRTIAHLMEDLHGVAPQDCWMVGDDFVRDALHPREAGWRAVWFVPNPQAAGTLPEGADPESVPQIIDLTEVARMVAPQE